MINEKVQEATQLYEELDLKNEKKLAGLSDKVAKMQSMELPVLSLALEEHTTKKMSQMELESEHDMQIIAKLAQLEAEMMKELCDATDENNQIEMEKLLNNSEIQGSETLQDCLELTADIDLCTNKL